MIHVNGVRIGGLSGIYNDRDYFTGDHERAPYTPNTLRSVFHLKHAQVERVKLLKDSGEFDVFLSHDWPQYIAKYRGHARFALQKKVPQEGGGQRLIGLSPGMGLVECIEARSLVLCSYAREIRCCGGPCEGEYRH